HVAAGEALTSLTSWLRWTTALRPGTTAAIGILTRNSSTAPSSSGSSAISVPSLTQFPLRSYRRPSGRTCRSVGRSFGSAPFGRWAPPGPSPTALWVFESAGGCLNAYCPLSSTSPWCPARGGCSQDLSVGSTGPPLGAESLAACVLTTSTTSVS